MFGSNSSNTSNTTGVVGRRPSPRRPARRPAAGSAWRRGETSRNSSRNTSGSGPSTVSIAGTSRRAGVGDARARAEQRATSTISTRARGADRVVEHLERERREQHADEDEVQRPANRRQPARQRLDQRQQRSAGAGPARARRSRCPRSCSRARRRTPASRRARRTAAWRTRRTRAPPGAPRRSASSRLRRAAPRLLSTSAFYKAFTTSSGSAPLPLDLAAHPAARHVVVDDPARLHRRVGGRRAHEAKAAPLELLRQRRRLRRDRRHVAERAGRARGARRARRTRPARRGARRARPPPCAFAIAASILPRWRTIAGVGEQAADVALAEPRDRLDLEARERRAEAPRACAGSSATTAPTGSPRARAARRCRGRR